MPQRPNLDAVLNKLDEISELARTGNVPIIAIVPTDEDHLGRVTAWARTPDEMSNMGVASVLFLLRSLPANERQAYVDSITHGLSATLADLGHHGDIGTVISQIVSKADSLAFAARTSYVPLLTALYDVSDNRIRTDVLGAPEHVLDLLSALLSAALGSLPNDEQGDFVQELLKRSGALAE